MTLALNYCVVHPYLLRLDYFMKVKVWRIEHQDNLENQLPEAFEYASNDTKHLIHGINLRTL